LHVGIQEGISLDDLIGSVSPRPAMPSGAMQFLSAANLYSDPVATRKGPRPNWAFDAFHNERLQDEFESHLEAVEVWDSRRRYLKHAISLSSIGAKLVVINPDDIVLIDASDERLAEIAEFRAKSALLLREAVGEEGDVHPRELCASTHRRRLRRHVKRVTAWTSAILGFVGGPETDELPAYADDWTLARWRDFQNKQRAWMEKHEIVSEQGVRVPLITVATNSLKARRASLYAMVIGLRERGKRDGFVPAFVTATLPAIWHANPKEGRNSYDPQLAPHHAAVEHGERWARIRALLKKSKVRYFGIRTIEPHEDGTPHVHWALWVHPNDVEELERVFRLHYPGLTAKDDIACKFKDWKKDGKADAASYVMHYVLKTLKNADGVDERGVERHERACAWASFLGLRRFAFVGLTSGILGRWRAAYALMQSESRLKAKARSKRKAEPKTESNPKNANDATRKATSAMRRKNWATALVHLGAFPDNQTFSPVSEVRETRWGDRVRQTIGWSDNATGEVTLVIRPIRWEIKPAKPSKHDEESKRQDFVQFGEVTNIASFPSSCQDNRHDIISEVPSTPAAAHPPRTGDDRPYEEPQAEPKTGFGNGEMPSRSVENVNLCFDFMAVPPVIAREPQNYAPRQREEEVDASPDIVEAWEDLQAPEFAPQPFVPAPPAPIRPGGIRWRTLAAMDDQRDRRDMQRDAGELHPRSARKLNPLIAAA
jgi:hypothetical protein